MTTTEKTTQARARQPAFLGLFEYRRLPGGRRRLRPNWNVIGVVLLLAAFVGFVGKTAVVYYMFKYQRDYKEVTLTQAMAFPLNRAEMRQMFGERQIEEAMELFAAKDVRSGYQLLDLGLRRAPGHLEGRLLMADFDRMTGRPEVAIRRLREGLEWHGQNPDYVRQFVRVLLAEREDAEMIELLESRFAALGTQPPELSEKILAYGGSQVLMMHGRFREAEEYLRRAELDKTAEGYALMGNILWMRGQHDAAIQMLERAVYQHAGQLAEPVHELLARLLREDGRYDEALRFALLRATNNPDSAAGRRELVRCYHELERHQRMMEEVDSYLRDFGDKEDALEQLANVAADLGEIEVSRKVYERAAENGFSMGSFGMLYIEAHLVAGKNEEAAALCQQLQDEGPEWIDRFAGQFNFLRAVAAKALGQTELAQLYTGRMLDRTLHPTELIAIARRYRTVGMEREAREALLRARSLDPTNEVVMSSLIELDLDQGNSGDLIELGQDMLALRRPPYSLIGRLRKRLSSDVFVFEPQRDKLLADLDAVLQEPSQG